MSAEKADSYSVFVAASTINLGASVLVISPGLST
jgi:hypothetical protein